jgi:hypothetical protein
MPDALGRVLSNAMGKLHIEMLMGEYGMYPSLAKAEIIAGGVIKVAATGTRGASNVLERIETDSSYLPILAQIVSSHPYTLLHYCYTLIFLQVWARRCTIRTNCLTYARNNITRLYKLDALVRRASAAHGEAARAQVATRVANLLTDNSYVYKGTFRKASAFCFLRVLC